MGLELETRSEHSLPKEEITRIKKAFGERREKITPTQKDILKKYNLGYATNGKRLTIFPMEGGERVIVGISPNDINAGKRISSLVVKLCEKQQNKKAK